MGESEVYDILAEVFNDVFMRDDIVLRPGLSAKDVLGWDSFKQIEIILAAEQRFGIHFSTKEVDRLERLDDLVKVIVARTNRNS
jgi:acyl carrier protein